MEKIIFVFLVLISILFSPVKICAKPEANELLFANFDSKKQLTNIGSQFGYWDKDPDDPTQSCIIYFSKEHCHGDSGRSLKIKYDVDSTKTAYNGLWFLLNDLDGSKYRRLVFYVKGDEEEGFTRKFKVELKNDKEKGTYVVQKIKKNWRKISIPLKHFKGITEFDRLKELIIVFDDTTVTKKEGVIYLDDISFR